MSYSQPIRIVVRKEFATDGSPLGHAADFIRHGSIIATFRPKCHKTALLSGIRFFIRDLGINGRYTIHDLTPKRDGMRNKFTPNEQEKRYAKFREQIQT